MKYLFVVQGEGRGHFTQALVMQGRIRMRGDEIAAFLVGKSSARRVTRLFPKSGNSTGYSIRELLNFLLDSAK